MKTKHICRLTIAMLAAVMLTASCSDDIEAYGEQIAKKAYLRLDKETVTLDDQGRATVRVEASDVVQWRIPYSYPDVLTVESADDYSYYQKGSGLINITSDKENNSEDDKTYTVEIQEDRFGLGTSFNVLVPGTYVKLSQTAFDGAGVTNLAATITANAAWEVYRKPSWISVNTTEGKRGQTSVQITVDKNPSTQERTGTISFSAAGLYLSVDVTQSGAAAELSVSSNTLEFTYDGKIKQGSKSVYITTNAPSWSVGNVTYVDDAAEEWVSFYDWHGSNYINFSVSANNHRYPRSAYLEVKAGGKTEQITIKQDGAPLTMTLSDTGITFQAGGNVSGYSTTYRKEVTVTTNASSWSVTANRSWINISKYNNYFVVTADEYTSTSTDRTGIITVTYDGETKTINVTQKAKGCDSIDREDFGGDKSLD